jgi:sarcosine oxidase, subunit alpha
VLVDEGPEPGGRLLAEGAAGRARELAGRAAHAGVEILAPASAIGCFDGLVGVWAADTLHQVRARRLVVATGSIEQPLVFAGNDLPGVMLSGGARRLAALYGVRPGGRAVVATTSDRGLEAALALRGAGVEVAVVADLRPAPAGPAVDALRAAGVALVAGTRLVAAEGRSAVRAAVVADAVGERTVACDLLVVSGGFVPADALLAQAGARTGFDRAAGCFRAVELPEHVLAAGDVAGARDAELSGAVAGAQAAHGIGRGDEASHERLAEDRAALGLPADAAAAAATVAVAAGEDRGRCFVCLCEDVTSKDLARSVAEGYDSIELAKRYTTVTMGPCQGRMCQLASVRVVGRETGQADEEVGLTTARPPWSAVPMGAFAGRPFEPAKRSALHAWHRGAGANVMWAGDWRRPYDYGDPLGEALAVHRAAGLIDVSSLGKLLVRGPEAGAFLDRLYPNRFSNLKPGRVRYGVLNTDAGRIFDDGTVCRLDDDTFYVTTTSSGAGAVEEWFAWWQADWRMAVHVSDVTQAVAAMNLAGPRARELLSSLTDTDCSNEALAYLDGRNAEVAGVPCLILRIGFVGELGYELHVSAAHAEHLWTTILEAGAEAGIRPFGMEPQRVLRLQKLHVIVGQDTDSESTPQAAAMPWIVKLDKEEDFVGRWALEGVQGRELETTLVGFTLADGEAPSEGAAVVAEGRPAGRVTSSRYSPQLDRVIGMAWVPAALARDGSSITISEDGRRRTAEVTTRPFYDPDGEVLRS